MRCTSKKCSIQTQAERMNLCQGEGRGGKGVVREFGVDVIHCYI